MIPEFLVASRMLKVCNFAVGYEKVTNNGDFGATFECLRPKTESGNGYAEFTDLAGVGQDFRAERKSTASEGKYLN